MALYPTWSRFLKLWKSIIYPVIKETVNVEYCSKLYGEVYNVDVYDKLTEADSEFLISQIQSALVSKGYEVALDHDDNSDLTILSKDDDMWAPYICINIDIYEYDDDEILEMDDQRFNGWDFNPDYIDFISARGLSDNYDNIRKAPEELKIAYCDWVRHADTRSHICVEIIPVNM